MLIDEAEIFVSSGRGGDGMVHFHREKYVNRGGPDGGDGGRGGNIILKVSHHINTLGSFRHKSRFVADNGGRGGINNSTGRSAAHTEILVPPGTMVFDAESSELLGDLVAHDDVLVVCRGGRGGRGNQHFASSHNQAPRTAEKGEPGEERLLRLELKLIADVGIVGVPNAGKSSFLAAVTNARPKIANYPFTNLEPNLGVAELDMHNSLILADIPGLIEGAHMGVGLGDAFLRHIQRTRILIHVLDGLAEDPMADFTQTNNELSLFDPNLGKKAQIVVFNKMDMPEAGERWPQVKTELEKRGYLPMPISALTRQDLQPVLWKAIELLKEAPEPEMSEALPVYRPMEDKRAFSIQKESEGWRVKGAASMTYWEYDGSIRRFQKLMSFLGVEDALRQAGIQEGDMVLIGDFELEWQD
ncbi:MAG: GTPase ObgE [Anaerolineae bacterium]|nr:GTPase ObgE [Anaerolineae bacterium]